jgi:hypothetical protein
MGTLRTRVLYSKSYKESIWHGHTRIKK